MRLIGWLPLCNGLNSNSFPNNCPFLMRKTKKELYTTAFHQFVLREFESPIVRLISRRGLNEIMCLEYRSDLWDGSAVSLNKLILFGVLL